MRRNRVKSGVIVMMRMGQVGVAARGLVPVE
jgi:hypothetical protein